MGTTKLTRKEILAEDPVHESMIHMIEFFKMNGKKVGIVAAVIVLLAVGVYGGLQYLDSRQGEAQQMLWKGMSYFHGDIAADATADPYGKGPVPTFKNETAKYQAAVKEFSSIVSGFGYSKISVVARYYLGLSQLQLGQKKEAVENLEAVSNNSKDRTVGYLAKKALATEYTSSGNYRGAKEILDGMLRDSQCDLPKEDLNIDLAKVLVAQGKRDEAIKVLREAGSQGQQLNQLQQRVMAELEKLQKAAKPGQQP